LQPAGVLAGHRDAPGRNREAELTVVAGIAHQEDQPPWRRGERQAAAHERAADAEAAQARVDGQRPEQQRRPIPEQQPPVADRPDQPPGLARDQRQTRLGLAADAIAVGGLALARDAEAEVEQALDAGAVERPLGVNLEHRWARVGGVGKDPAASPAPGSGPGAAGPMDDRDGLPSSGAEARAQDDVPLHARRDAGSALACQRPGAAPTLGPRVRR
jgi:hypothetical protein